MVHIREATLEDLPEMLRIYNHSVRHSAATFDLEEQTLEQRKEWFSHYGGKYPLIVAETENGRIAGYGSLSVFRTKPAYDSTVENSVYLDQDYQGRKIGSLLLQELIVRAKAFGYHAIIAGITEGNDISIRLHEKFGFELIGTFKEVGKKFGEWHSVVFYQLILE